MIQAPQATYSQAHLKPVMNVEKVSETLNKAVHPCPTEKMNEEELNKIIYQTNEQLCRYELELNFEKHEVLNEYIVTLVDSKTKEVIKEIPSKKILDYVAGMQELLGMLVDKRI